MGMITEQEADNRAAVAAKLAATLYRHHFTAFLLKILTPGGWEAAARLAGVKPPSDKTKALVIQLTSSP